MEMVARDDSIWSQSLRRIEGSANEAAEKPERRFGSSPGYSRRHPRRRSRGAALARRDTVLLSLAGIVAVVSRAVERFNRGA